MAILITENMRYDATNNTPNIPELMMNNTALSPLVKSLDKTVVFTSFFEVIVTLFVF